MSGGGVSCSLALGIYMREGREENWWKGREGKGTEAYQFCSVAATTTYESNLFQLLSFKDRIFVDY